MSLRRTRLFIVLGTALLLSALPGLAGDAVELSRRPDAAHRVKLRLPATLAASWKDVNVGRLVVQTPGRQRRLDLAPLPASRDLDVDLVEALSDCVLVVAELGPAPAKGFPSSWQRLTRVSSSRSARPATALRPEPRAGAPAPPSSPSRETSSR